MRKIDDKDLETLSGGNFDVAPAPPDDYSLPHENGPIGSEPNDPGGYDGFLTQDSDDGEYEDLGPA